MRPTHCDCTHFIASVLIVRLRLWDPKRYAIRQVTSPPRARQNCLNSCRAPRHSRSSSLSVSGVGRSVVSGGRGTPARGGASVSASRGGAAGRYSPLRDSSGMASMRPNRIALWRPTWRPIPECRGSRPPSRPPAPASRGSSRGTPYLSTPPRRRRPVPAGPADHPAAGDALREVLVGRADHYPRHGGSSAARAAAVARARRPRARPSPRPDPQGAPASSRSANWARSSGSIPSPVL